MALIMSDQRKTLNGDWLNIQLVYVEEFDRIIDAYDREKQVQNWSRSKREALIQGNFSKLPELAKKDFGKKKTD
jgi:putative endonuclease